MVSRLTGAEIDFVTNPRKEAAENDLFVENRQLLDLGLDPITLEDGLMREVIGDRAALRATAATSTRSRAAVRTLGQEPAQLGPVSNAT